MNRAYGDSPWDARETSVYDQFIYGLNGTDLKIHVFFRPSLLLFLLMLSVQMCRGRKP